MFIIGREYIWGFSLRQNPHFFVKFLVGKSEADEIPTIVTTFLEGAAELVGKGERLQKFDGLLATSPFEL